MTADLAIGELADLLRGNVPANTTEAENGERFFGLAEISHGGATTRVLLPDVDLERAVRLQEHDIVVALLGKIGDVVIVGEEAVGCVLGRECAALRIRADERRVIPQWLYLVMRSSQFRQRAALGATGSTMPRLSPKVLAEMTVPIPSIDIQARLWSRLAAFDDAISTHRDLIESLCALRDAEIDLAASSPEQKRKTVGGQGKAVRPERLQPKRR
ncbi:MAG: restriction endonuclease subunit S [Acidimicrobiia bacterium]|nr:restriction endonuclease subunit S [Acidimicrobiia bacterium]